MIGAIIGITIGVVLAFIFDVHIPGGYTVYTAIAILAVSDSVMGAIASLKEKKFDLKILCVGVITNGIIAILMVYIGKLLDLELVLAVILWFGVKILKKISIFRKFLLNKCEKKVTIEEETLQKD